MASPSSQPPISSKSPSKCLLCVDDHAEVLSIMEDFLRVSGYSVLTAPSGIRGLQLRRRSSVDAVILDFEMPKMDGAELALRIKSEWPELPVLMFTGYPADVPEEIRRSVDAFVVKGDPADTLLQTLERLLPSNGEGKNAPAEQKAQARASTSPRGRRRSA